MKNTCLLIIDVQKKLFPVIPENQILLKNIQILIQGFNVFNLPILISEQVPDKLGRTIEPIKSLTSHIKPIIKSSFSCMLEPSFKQRVSVLDSIDGFVIAGLETHICVYQTVRDLLLEGHKVEVAADAVASRNVQNKQIAIDRINHIGGEISSAEMSLFQLQKTSKSPSFKELSKIVK